MYSEWSLGTVFFALVKNHKFRVEKPGFLIFFLSFESEWPEAWRLLKLNHVFVHSWSIFYCVVQLRFVLTDFIYFLGLSREFSLKKGT